VGRGVEFLQLRGVERRHAEVERGAEPRDGLEGVLRGGPYVEQDRRCACPQGEGHGVAEAVGEEQLGRREDHLVLAHAQDAAPEQLAGHDHVAVSVDTALGPAGRARRCRARSTERSRPRHRLEFR